MRSAVAMRLISHVHSTWSYDGRHSLGEIQRRFTGRAEVILMTEHDRGFTQARLDEYRASCLEHSDARTRLIPGIEYSDPSNVMHVLVWGVPDFLGEGVGTSELLAKVRDHGGIAVLAHPTRKEAWRRWDDRWTGCLAGIEVWNRKTDGIAPSRAGWELARRTGLTPWVGLDFHRPNQDFPLRMEMDGSGMGESPDPIEAMRSGARPVGRALGLPVSMFGSAGLASVCHVLERARRMARPLVGRRS